MYRIPRQQIALRGFIHFHKKGNSKDEKKTFLIIGAHPDDPDIRFGGTAIKLIRAGHEVKFVSLTNGCCGHHIQSGKELANRRYAETQAAKERIGLTEYSVPVITTAKA